LEPVEVSASDVLSVEQFDAVFQMAKEFPNFEPNESFRSSGIDVEVGYEIYVSVRLLRAYLKGLFDAGLVPDGVVFDILDYESRFEPLAIVSGNVQAALVPDVALGLVPLLREISCWLDRLGDTFVRTGFTSAECAEVIDRLGPISL
jgi:hypothetical protein